MRRVKEEAKGFMSPRLKPGIHPVFRRQASKGGMLHDFFQLKVGHGVVLKSFFSERIGIKLTETKKFLVVSTSRVELSLNITCTPNVRNGGEKEEFFKKKKKELRALGS